MDVGWRFCVNNTREKCVRRSITKVCLNNRCLRQGTALQEQQNQSHPVPSGLSGEIGRWVSLQNLQPVATWLCDVEPKIHRQQEEGRQTTNRSQLLHVRIYVRWRVNWGWGGCECAREASQLQGEWDWKNCRDIVRAGPATQIASEPNATRSCRAMRWGHCDQTYSRQELVVQSMCKQVRSRESGVE